MKTFIVTDGFIQMIDTSTSEQRLIQSQQHPRQYNNVLRHILSKQLDTAFELMENVVSEVVDVEAIRAEASAAILASKTSGRFTMETDANSNRTLFYVDTQGTKVQISGRFFERVLEAFDNPEAMGPITKFLEKVEANKYSDVAAVDLFEFLAVNGHPLTTDGDFLAFKIVRDDLYDFHSGTVLHEVGSIVALDPSQVDFDRSRTCSSGLHFCSRDYLPQYGGFFGDKSGAILILKISPADVAAFPRDYKNAKGRAVQYQILARIPNDQHHHVINHVLNQRVVDVARDITDVKTVTTRTYRQFSETQFEEMVEAQVEETVARLATDAGPAPTIASGRWTVCEVNTDNGRQVVVANAPSREKAREICKRFNNDYATQRSVYRVVDQLGE